MLERAAFSLVVACGYPDEIEPRSVITIKIELWIDRKQADDVDSSLRAGQDFSLGLLSRPARTSTHFAPERRSGKKSAPAAAILGGTRARINWIR